MISDLSQTKILSFEIGNKCNLSNLHDKCPINKRVYKNKKRELNVERITKAIDEAVLVGFNGYIAFHYYNEPLLYIDSISRVIDSHPEQHYLLWTNGLLLSRDVIENELIRKFKKVVITCYDKNDSVFLKELQSYYGNIQIAYGELDDRLKIYDSLKVNESGCIRVLYEMPIDYYGNIHLCCQDWNNTFQIGNIFDESLDEIVRGEVYQKLLSLTNSKLIDNERCPPICKKCNDPWIKIWYEV